MPWKTGTTKWKTKVNSKGGMKSGARKPRSKVPDDKTDFKRSFKVACLSYPTQGITVSNYIYDYISPRLDTGSIINVQQMNEFKMLALVYDRFRVNSVSVKYTPRANVMNVYDTVDGSLTAGSGVVYVAQLRDGKGPSHPAQMKRVKGCRAISILKPFRSTYKVKYPKNMWLDCADPNQSNQQGLVESLGLQGGITVYGENFPEVSGTLLNNPWYDVEISFSCTFNTYNPKALSQDGTGIKLDRQDALPNYDPSRTRILLDEEEGGTAGGQGGHYDGANEVAD